MRSRWSLGWGGTGPCSLVQWPLRRMAPSRLACTAWGGVLGSPAAGFSGRQAVEVMAGVGRDGARLLGAVALASHGPVPPRMHRVGGYFGFRLRRAFRDGMRSRWSLGWGGTGPCSLVQWPWRRTAPSRPASTAGGGYVGLACGGPFAAACGRGGAWGGAGGGEAAWDSGAAGLSPRLG